MEENEQGELWRGRATVGVGRQQQKQQRQQLKQMPPLWVRSWFA